MIKLSRLVSFLSGGCVICLIKVFTSVNTSEFYSRNFYIKRYNQIFKQESHLSANEPTIIDIVKYIHAIDSGGHLNLIKINEALRSVPTEQRQELVDAIACLLSRNEKTTLECLHKANADTNSGKGGDYFIDVVSAVSLRNPMMVINLWKELGGKSGMEIGNNRVMQASLRRLAQFHPDLIEAAMADIPTKPYDAFSSALILARVATQGEEGMARLHAELLEKFPVSSRVGLNADFVKAAAPEFALTHAEWLQDKRAPQMIIDNGIQLWDDDPEKAIRLVERASQQIEISSKIAPPLERMLSYQFDNDPLATGTAVRNLDDERLRQTATDVLLKRIQKQRPTEYQLWSDWLISTPSVTPLAQ
jgi:hypothetical protein